MRCLNVKNKHFISRTTNIWEPTVVNRELKDKKKRLLQRPRRRSSPLPATSAPAGPSGSAAGCTSGRAARTTTTGGAPSSTGSTGRGSLTRRWTRGSRRGEGQRRGRRAGAQPAFSRNRIFEIAFRTTSVDFAGPIINFLLVFAQYGPYQTAGRLLA